MAGTINSNNPVENTAQYDNNTVSRPGGSLGGDLTERATENTNETQPGRINWLGSSYTGADIKMVAHLYTPTDQSREILALQEEIRQYDQFISALDGASQAVLNLAEYQISGVLAENSEVTISALGAASLGTPESRLLIQIFWSVRIADWNRRKNQISTLYKARAESYRNLRNSKQSKLDRLQEVQEKASQTVTLATLQTLSVQTFRQKQPVRALGHSYAKSYTRSNRTIGGSMIFTVFNEHALAHLIRSMSATGSIYGELDTELSTYIADQLPPFDVTIAFANEYGSVSQMNIYGIEFVTDGMTFSVEDLLTEEVMQFVCRDIDVMTSKGNVPLSLAQRGMNAASNDTARDQSASNLMLTSKDAYAEYLQRLGLKRRRTQY